MTKRLFAVILVGLAACQTTTMPSEATDPKILEWVQRFVSTACVTNVDRDGYDTNQRKIEEVGIADVDYGADGWIRADIMVRGVRDNVYVQKSGDAYTCGRKNWKRDVEFYQTIEEYEAAMNRTW